jgi:hypothetical protein
MIRQTLLVSAMVIAGLLLASELVGRAQRQLPSAGLTCRHDEASVPADRIRREQARALLRAINTAEGRAAQATRQYVPLAKLPNLPAAPAGFELRLYTDGNGYLVSLKDSRDPCHYGVFSDEDGRLYEMSPQLPLIAS